LGELLALLPTSVASLATAAFVRVIADAAAARADARDPVRLIGTAT
jgi:hypothetical protein